MNLPLIDAAEYFLNLKQAAEEILPVVEEHADDGELLHALSEAARSKLGLAIAYRVYSESLRDPSNSAIGEHFKEHSEDCLNDVDFFVRRSSVMSGGASLEGVESPPASGDLTEILQVLSKMEEANLQLMSELVVLLEGNPSKYEVEAMMAKDQHHLDDLTQHMPVAPELPSVAEELPSVEEAASPAAPLGVIGPAKMAGVSAKRGLSRVGELLSGSRVKKLEGLSEKLRDGKPLGDHAVVVNVRRLTRAQKGVEAERNSVRTARAITAIGATGVGAAGAHKLRSKKKDGEEKTSEMGAAAMGCHPQVSPPPPLTGAAAGQHAGLADKVASAVREALKSQAKNMRSHANRVKVKVNLPGAVPIETAKERSATGKLKDFFSKKTWSRGGAAALAGVSAAGAVGATHAAHEDEHEKAAARTYDMGGSKRDGKAYSMHTTPDDYELSQLISSKMDRDLRGVRGKAKNEGMLVGSGLGAVKGLKAGKGWGGGQVIRTGGGGGTVIGTFGSGGKMPKGMGADIRENQGMIRDELRGQGIKIGADKSDSELAETGRQRAIANLASGFTSDKHTSGERHGTLAGRLGGAAVGAGAGALASRGATLPVRLAAGMGGAVIGGSMGGQIGKTIGSDHDAEKFWANHKEAAEGVAESFGRAAGRVVKHTGLHDAVVSGGAGPLVNAIKKPFVDIKDGIVSGYNKGADETKGWKERHTKEAGAMSSAAKWLAAHPAAVGGVAGSAIGAAGGSSEMAPVLGKRVMRSAKQVWDKAVKEAMGEEVPVEQYLQEEAAGRQAQEAAESDYLRQLLQQTTQQLEQAQAQAQEQEAQVGEMQGTIQQLQGQQAEQAQAADAAVQTARQTAEAAMSQSMQRSAELMKQTQLAAGLQNAAATMKEQLMALSQTPVPPATVGEAGELDAAAQQQVGQDQAMEEQAAMEQEAQMAAAQGAPPAAAPALPKTAGMISGAGKILRNAPGGVVGGVVGAASAAGLGALLRNKETAFLQDAVKKLEAKQQGGFLTGMMLAEARMVADRSAVMDQHPGKAALLNAVRGAGAGFALDKTIRHIS